MFTPSAFGRLWARDEHVISSLTNIWGNFNVLPVGNNAITVVIHYLDS